MSSKMFLPGLATPWIFRTLKKRPSDFGKYVDSFLYNHKQYGLVIVVRTGCGGVHRRDHKAMFEKMSKHDLFLCVEDHGKVSGNADLLFKTPDGFLDRVVDEGVSILSKTPHAVGRAQEDLRQILRESMVEDRSEEDRRQAAIDAVITSVEKVAR